MVGSVVTTVSVSPTYVVADGFNRQSFLLFSKTSPTTGHQYLSVGLSNIDVTSALTMVTVVSFLENMEDILLSMQRHTEFLGFEVHRSSGLQFCVCTLTGGNECSNLCTDTVVLTNVWLQSSYTYNPSATNKQLLTVSYISSGSTVTLTKTSTTTISGLSQRKYAFGYSVSGCSGNQNFIVPDGCPDRSNFELTGFYFTLRLTSDADITILFQVIVDS